MTILFSSSCFSSNFEIANRMYIPNQMKLAVQISILYELYMIRASLIIKLGIKNVRLNLTAPVTATRDADTTVLDVKAEKPPQQPQT
jgi:hypothetical protein